MRGGSWRISGKIPNPLHTFQASKLSYENKKLHKIPEIPNDDFTMLVLASNPLKTFNGLNSYENLHELSVNKTKIETFEGAVEIPHLQKFTCYQAPLEKINYLRIMAIIAFGKSLIVVNNVPIPEKERQFADQYADTIRTYIQSGFVITSMNPLRIHNPKTKERKTFYKEKGAENESFSPDRIALQVPLKKFSFGSPKAFSARGKSTRTSDTTDPASDLGSPGITKAESASQVKLDNSEYIKKAQVQFEKESLEKKPRKSSGAEEGDVKTRDLPFSTEITSLTEDKEILVVTDDEDKKDTEDHSGSAPSSGRKRRGSINLVTAPVLKLDSDDDDDDPHMVRRRLGLPEDHNNNKENNNSTDKQAQRKSSIAPQTTVNTSAKEEEDEYEYYYEEDLNEILTQTAYSEAMNIVPPIRKVTKAGSKEEGIRLEKDLEISTSLDSLIPPHRVTKDNSDEESRELVNSFLVTSNVNEEDDQRIKVENEESKEETTPKEDSKLANEEIEKPKEEIPKVEEEEEKVEEKKEVEEEKTKSIDINSTEARKSLELCIHIPKLIGEATVEETPKKDELEPVPEEDEDEEGLPIIDDASDEDNNILMDEEPEPVKKPEPTPEPAPEPAKEEEMAPEKEEEKIVEEKPKEEEKPAEKGAKEGDKDDDFDLNGGKKIDIFKVERPERKKADFKLPEWKREKIHFEKTPEIDSDALLFF
ncbi:hypothetical protein TVAG_391420 [Trichomonas vaginalis G3]|uniref:Uncharacterized protein n=1 Tax=Trichomonas vaginalis (strain ATCC PRA-98 / G3) TaxID=412133 RepID=A2DFQ5_TRIV3|nr:ribonuclease inhibitor domain-containing protein [Trichomonas vaginalis G3]EAY20758.1 hypothetical protein TVAG_391420 [Trichomonas vaginalis G3]KAI5529456.1 ribonuclease inhibitor domain-containing protein [Trichomonas vaginalis G3]|eukprot:XP_001581744.1 hypothetical protein [Trichomonas vaginalis G3]